MFKHTLAGLLLSTLAFTAPAFATDTSVANPDIESVISMPTGHFFENLTYHNDSELIATDYTGQTLYKYNEQGRASLWTKVDGHPVSIRFDEKGEGLLAVHKVSIMQGAEFLNHMALYKVSADGTLSHLIDLDKPAFLNGMVYLGQQQYLIGDAANGKIYQFDATTKRLTTWLEDERLQPEQDRPGLPGVNGIQLYKGDLYFTNSAKQLLGKVTIEKGKAGAIEVVETKLQADDFIIDKQGTWYITTHHHEIIKYTANGERTVVLNHGIEGSTAIQMSKQDNGYFYITNDGGLLFGGKDSPGLHKVRF